MKSLLTLAVLLIATTAAFAQFETDHFKCYLPTSTSPLPPQAVQLQDQFATNGAKVKTIWRFCNPTKKDHNGVITPIINPDAHLAIHLAGSQPVVNRQVTLSNQFGVQTILTGQARYLAVPTQKDPHGPAFNLDHFNCYVVTNGQPAAATVDTELLPPAARRPRTVEVYAGASFWGPFGARGRQPLVPLSHRSGHAVTCERSSRDGTKYSEPPADSEGRPAGPS